MHSVITTLCTLLEEGQLGTLQLLELGLEQGGLQQGGLEQGGLEQGGLEQGGLEGKHEVSFCSFYFGM